MKFLCVLNVTNQDVRRKIFLKPKVNFNNFNKLIKFKKKVFQETCDDSHSSSSNEEVTESISQHMFHGSR